jgi:hypothetical protein
MVNGVKYETTGAQVVIDGGTPVTGDDSQLRVGMVVSVEGQINDDGVTGTATKVTFDDTIQGPVAVKTPGTTTGTATLTVMGKEVTVAQDTKIDDSVGGAKTLDDVVATGMVEVSGGVDDQGRIVATHIELKDVNAISEVTGVVTDITPPQIGVANIPVITTGPIPALGSLVEVKGSFSNGVLTATSIEVKSGIPNDNNLHFEGFITSGDSGSFVIQGHHLNQTLTVTTTGSTIFMGGVKADLVVGTKVEVEGALTGTNVVATKVKFKENVRLEITAASPDSAREGIELRLLSGVTVITDANTRIDPPNGIVLATDSLRIRGRLNRDGNKVIATRLEIRPLGSNPERVKLRGPVTAINGTTSLTILGVTVPAGTTFRPNDDNSNDDNAASMTAAEFFAKVKVGTVVKADGTLDIDNTFVTRELELED